ncbi:hypothetical protein FB451DRAFT_1415094 [Mycena latifolia]|nr:hypothetical protein FB451DRAFT_1415094 [Mycena latifolia]
MPWTADTLTTTGGPSPRAHGEEQHHYDQQQHLEQHEYMRRSSLVPRRPCTPTYCSHHLPHRHLHPFVHHRASPHISLRPAFFTAAANDYAHVGPPPAFVHLVGPPLHLALDAGSGRRVMGWIWMESGRGAEAEARTHFGLYATGALRAGEEVVVDWEWDDANAVHRVGEVAAGLPPTPTPNQLVAQLANILHMLSGAGAGNANLRPGSDNPQPRGGADVPAGIPVRGRIFVFRRPRVLMRCLHNSTASIGSRTPSRRAFVRPLVSPHPGAPMAPPPQNGGGVIQVVHTDDAVTKLSAPLLQSLHHRH